MNFGNRNISTTKIFTARSNGVYLFSCTVKSPVGKYLVSPLTGNRNKNLMARKLVTSTKSCESISGALYNSVGKDHKTKQFQHGNVFLFNFYSL